MLTKQKSDGVDAGLRRRLTKLLPTKRNVVNTQFIGTRQPTHFPDFERGEMFTAQPATAPPGRAVEWYTTEGWNKFRASSILGSIIRACEQPEVNGMRFPPHINDKCKDDADKRLMYDTVAQFAVDYGADSSAGVAEKDARVLEKEFCDQLRVMLDANRNQ